MIVLYRENEEEKDNYVAIDDRWNIINGIVVMIIYNFDNYYHYLYDTLPYLYTYLDVYLIDFSIYHE